MWTTQETFGISGSGLAAEQQADPQSNPSPVATTRAAAQPPANPLKAILDPQGSAIFWLALAALVGLVLVHGEAHVATRFGVGGRVGRR